MKKFCLNMIVRNEGERIIRCLESVADYVSCYEILDTGSTDNTVELIQKFFSQRVIPGHVTKTKFVNFEQARNEALQAARLSSLYFEYILLVDADMELVVEDKEFADNLSGASYDVIQRAGTLAYGNRRIVHRGAVGEYRGVTHEYLDIETAGLIPGVWFRDHADGSNRKDKFKRDVKLLREALKTEPNNGRYWFYLGQSYRDAGQPEKAVRAYKRRIELGGWDEEQWNAHLNYAHCLKELGNEAGFVTELLAAYNFRPSRAEPLYDLAKHYRETGKNAVSTALSEIGMTIPYPRDLLFVSDYVYQVGFREEFAITAFYGPKRAKGFEVCDELSLDISIPHWSRDMARRNLFHYTPILSEIAPISIHKIPFTAPDGYISMNPSIVTMKDGSIRAIVRTVNYTITETGHYQIRGGDGTINGSNPIHTRNFMVHLTPNFELEEAKEIDCPLHIPKYDLVRGMEDMRLFECNGRLWASTCIREANEEGWCEQFFCRLDEYETRYGVKLTYMKPPERAHEKNWMPMVVGDRFQFVYRLGTILRPDGAILVKHPMKRDLDHLSGGSQSIRLYNGSPSSEYLAVVHEARERPDNGQRAYTHRFVLMDERGEVLKVSAPFFIENKQIEFVAGLALHPDGKRLMISYGVRDCEARIVTIDYNDVVRLLR